MINEIRLEIAEFLGTTLIDTNYLFIDYWTFLHLVSGFLGMWLIFKLLRNYDTKRKFIVLPVFMFFWEVFEFSLPSFIRPEKFIDIFYDFILGFAGGYLFYYLKQRK